jgi:hypothetical protein
MDIPTFGNWRKTKHNVALSQEETDNSKDFITINSNRNASR